ncbi:putative hydroxyacylglutathione hydrolase [Cucumispora dikerogammari]|nr:putative hydroxyacylglutathione hydrolase [Cucumispora dikerogammari]
MFVSIQVLEDNYTHFVYNAKYAIAFDCVWPELVLQLLNKDLSAFKKESITKSEINDLPNLLLPRELLGFFTTHRHIDHSAGDNDMKKVAKHYKIGDQQTLVLDKWNIKGIATPCHTSDSVCFQITGEEETPLIITGDTLFMLGCGKFNEGPAEMMFSNFRKLEKLEGLVLYGHNYNTDNIAFAELYGDREIPEEIKNKRFLRMSNEAKFNPFILAETPEKLGELRQLKNNFKL